MKGKTLKHYRVEDSLGKGGMGVVYSAFDTRLQRRVALKILPAEFTEHADRRRRFLQEARAAAATGLEYYGITKSVFERFLTEKELSRPTRSALKKAVKAVVAIYTK